MRHPDIPFEFVLEKSSRKGKQLMSTFTYKGKKREVHFGDPKMREYPGTERGDNYCARSFGIIRKNGEPTRNDPMSPNYWSRRVLWDCKGKKSIKR